jgi:EpsI family protein
LLGKTTVAAIVPSRLPDWTSRDVSDLVAPKEEDSLAARIYGETVGRVYTQASTGAEVMMLLAHGNTQSDDLQLHRPEVCYPAFGYAIHQNEEFDIPITPGVAIPGRDLVAVAPDHRETIRYWSRLGEYFPISRGDQHVARLRTSLKGVIADGILSRFSVEGVEPSVAFSTMDVFIPSLIKAVAPVHRPALIGTALSQKMASAGV